MAIIFKFFQNRNFFGLLIVVLVFLGAYGLYKSSYQSGLSPGPISSEEGEVYEVLMTDQGFVPEEITIYEGQVIEFKTSRGEDFWPASNFHPSHSLYSAFDPLKPILSSESWTFTFDEPGEYRYHDHLFPSAQGIINVISLDGVLSSSELEKCYLEGDTSDPRCWDILIRGGWEKDGIVGGFDVISYLYENEPKFLDDSCHRYAHVVGDYAFEKFFPDRENYREWEFPPETAACGYGFYHGLFEHLFREDRNIDLAINICDFLTERWSEQFPAIRRNCYHGMGHGFMPESPPEETWGNPLVMTGETLVICDTISEDMTEVRECYQGAFNVLADWMDFRNFGLSPNLDDPMWVCHEQENYEYQSACYYEFAMRAPNYVDGDLKAVSDKFIGDMEDDVLAGVIMHSAAATLMERNVGSENLSELVLVCRDIQDRLHKDCVQGLAGGLVAHGEPGKEYVDAVSFCSSELFTENEKELCFNNIFTDLSASYTSSQMKNVCDYIKDDFYKTKCLERFK